MARNPVLETFLLVMLNLLPPFTRRLSIWLVVLVISWPYRSSDEVGAGFLWRRLGFKSSQLRSGKNIIGTCFSTLFLYFRLKVAIPSLLHIRL
jgi:hypothetical protein